MSVFSRGDWGRLMLRLAIGGLMLFHGIAKVQHGVGGIEGMLESSGLPAALAYGAYVGEVLAPLLVLAGIFTIPAAAVMAFNMLIAIYVGHSSDIFALNDYGGWAIELPMLYLLGAVAIVFLGPGDMTIGRAPE